MRQQPAMGLPLSVVEHLALVRLQPLGQPARDLGQIGMRQPPPHNSAPCGVRADSAGLSHSVSTRAIAPSAIAE